MNTRNIAHLLFASTLLGLSYTTNASACEEKMRADGAQIKTELSDLNQQGQKAVLFNFTDGKCESLEKAQSDAAVSGFVPQDETSQGLYSLYRSRGEQSVDALKDVYKFISANS